MQDGGAGRGRGRGESGPTTRQQLLLLAPQTGEKVGRVCDNDKVVGTVHLFPLQVFSKPQSCVMILSTLFCLPNYIPLPAKLKCDPLLHS